MRKKFFKYSIYSCLSILMILALIIFGKIGAVCVEGYNMYNEVINEISIEEKITEIKADENYVSIEDIPEDFIEAIISVEDHRFYNHNGIDIIATGRVVLTNLSKGRIVAGGSTITQQLAKNMFFSFEKKYARKVAELLVAFQLEDKLSKAEILELYSNIIYFGNGYYGITEASNGYFEVGSKELNKEQAIVLAGIPKSPNVYNPENSSHKTIGRAELVLQSMVNSGFISIDESVLVISSLSNMLGTLK